jgi:hypothetical protein
MQAMTYLLITVIAAGPYVATAQTASPGRCVAAMQATGYQACAEAPHGIALAGTPERATSLASFAQAGEERFALTFGRTPTPYAVAELREQDTLKDDQAKLKALGYRSILPWISHDGMIASVTASMKQAAAAQARTQGLSPQAEAELARTMLAGQSSRLSRFKMDESDAGTVPHELGHMWYAETYWPDRPPAQGRYYGTPAPDWLDEIAAILMESQELADGRRRTFLDVYHGRAKEAFAGQPASELIDLRLFLNRIHPGFGSNKAEHAEQQRTGKTIVVVKTGPEAAATARIAGLFYSTGRVVADYMTDRAGGLTVFPAIADALAKGDTLDTWLARNGARYRLPATLDALDADWRSWLEARFGKPGSAPKPTTPNIGAAG